MPDPSTIPFKQADPNGHYRSKQLPNDSGDFMLMLGLPAFAGDVVGPAASTTGQVAVFDDGTGKRLNVATQTGLAKLFNGVLAAVAAPNGAVVGTTDPQTLTNKTLINPTLEGVTGFDKDDVGLGNVDNTADAVKPVSGPQQAALDLKEDKNKKAVANGYASLDAAVKIPLAQIPDSVLGGQQYQGTWNAATNTPAIPTAAIGNKGWYYSVAVAGTTNINGISSWAVGDEIISNGSVWQKIVNVSAVNSVNGYTGVVVLGKADVGLGNVDNTSDSAKPVSAATVTQLNLKEDKANKNVANGYAGLDATGKVPVANVPADLVTSVASKQGLVTLVKGDVGLGNVDNTSDATKNAAAVTLTNKTINGANNTLTVRLANDVTGNLPVTNLNSGTGANSGSFWRGDGQWAPPAGGGDVIGPAGAVDSDLAVYNGATGKILKTTGVQISSLATNASLTSLVTGPASATDLALPVYSGTTGKVIKVPTAAELFAAVGPTIWSVRNRSFNALGNPNFEVDQRNIGALVSPATGGFAVDRWSVGYVGTMTVSTQQLAENVVVPGTSFYVTSKYLRTKLTAQDSSLAAGEYLGLVHTVDGPGMRELLGDVHSVQVLARFSVANLKFVMALVDSGGTRSLCKLCTLGAANTWTLITLPNLPVWAAGGGWTTAWGVVGYTLGFYLASGSTGIAPAADVWQTGNYKGLAIMDNFCASAVNSTFDLAFVQHEPGSECSTLMDVSWANNLWDCLPYYYKSTDYNALPSAGTVTGAVHGIALPNSGPIHFHTYTRPLAKTVQPIFYTTSNGAPHWVYDAYGASPRQVSAYVGFNSKHCGYPQLTSYNAGIVIYTYHVSADTGW